MNTPGHAVVSVAVAQSVGAPHLWLPVLLGAVLPDVPIAVLYVDAKLRRRLPDERIWSEVYRQRFWQDVIHGAHSIPLAAAGVTLSWFAGSAYFGALFVSLFAHALCDLPIHGKDAHRHFFPFSDYRFLSPLSYWDVTRHARVVLAVEIAVVALAAAAILVSQDELWVRCALVAAGVFYIDAYRRLWRPLPVGPVRERS